MDLSKFIILTLCAIVVCLRYTEGAKILAAFPFSGKSHFMMTKVIVEELIKRGHEVTFITSFSLDGPKNYTEILIDPPYDVSIDIRNTFNAESAFDLTKFNQIAFFKMIEAIGVKSTEHALKNQKVQEIINSTETKDKYDLLLAEQFFQEAFLPLAVKYNIPTITLCTFGYANYISQMMGVITPYSHVPHGWLSYDDKMNFIERMINVGMSMYDDYFREVIYFPQQDELVKKYYSQLRLNIPPVSKLEKNISLMLLNNYYPLLSPRPEVPGMIAVGGVHIKKPHPLPEDIKKFLDGADNGAVYFNMGTNVRSVDLPPEKLAIFLEIFKNLKQRVLWKWEDDKIPDLPSNVMVKKWLPQNDILAHPNIKAFVTHGGLMGVQEGVFHGVPMLGFPVFCDQYLNLKKAERSNYAIMLDFQTMTKDDLETAFHQILYNPVYMNNIKKFSKIFRDRPMDVLDTAMYWIEYVIRYQGAPQLRSAGADLPWYTFYLVDIIGTICGGFVFLIVIIVMTCKKLFTKSKSKNPKKKKN